MRVAVNTRQLFLGAALVAAPTSGWTQVLRTASTVADTQSLLGRPAHLHMQQASLLAALTELSQRSGVALAYSPSLLPADARVTCACGSMSIGEALDRLLARTPFTYREADGQIVLIPKQPPRTDVGTGTRLADAPAPGVAPGAAAGDAAADAARSTSLVMLAAVGQVPPRHVRDAATVSSTLHCQHPCSFSAEAGAWPWTATIVGNMVHSQAAAGRRLPGSSQPGTQAACCPYGPRRAPHQHSERDHMARLDDKKIIALAKKNAAKSLPKKNAPKPTYDATLPAQADDEDLKQFFSEMKKREF